MCELIQFWKEAHITKAPRLLTYLQCYISLSPSPTDHLLTKHSHHKVYIYCSNGYKSQSDFHTMDCDMNYCTVFTPNTAAVQQTLAGFSTETKWPGHSKIPLHKHLPQDLNLLPLDPMSTVSTTHSAIPSS